VEGSVTSTTAKNRVQLKPGLEATYTPRDGFSVNTFDESEVLSWMKGIYYFHNTPLKDLAKLLPRWFNMPVQFDSPSLQNKTFSGELLKNQSLQLFLDNLEASSGEINVYVKDNVVHFR
jgi:ferric-dicitrate binding protein FerR (iron transport regulator)